MKRASLESESPMATLNKCKVRVKNLEKNWKSKELDRMVVSRELERVKHDADQLDRDNKMLQGTTEDVLLGAFL